MSYLEKNILKMENGKIVNHIHLKVQKTNKGYTILGKKNGRTFKKVVRYNECDNYGKRLKDKHKTYKNKRGKRKSGK
uniref:Uncharacterized protein n=1 Tax=viral metagenome TaxID=1070528 RepID=A0A6C0JIR4_9ZZZZ